MVRYRHIASWWNILWVICISFKLYKPCCGPSRLDETTQGWAASHAMRCDEQVGDDLGARLYVALAQMLAQGAKTVGAIGTDCPIIDASYIERAFAAADDTDIVIAPAEDGGYGLIVVSQPIKEIFTDIRWGTEHVLSETLAAAEHLGCCVNC